MTVLDEDDGIADAIALRAPGSKSVSRISTFVASITSGYPFFTPLILQARKLCVISFIAAPTLALQ